MAQPALRSLTLHEAFAAAPEAAALVDAFAGSLTELSVTGCQAAGPKSPAKLWGAIGRCTGLEVLSYGFCKAEASTEALVAAGLADKSALRSLTLRGLTRLTPAGLLSALNAIKAKNLEV